MPHDHADAPSLTDAHADAHPHVFLGAGHDGNERKTWAVIALCSVMMVVEIGGGSLFGSLAVVADGLHMSTHAAAMLIAALAYTYARRHASDPRFAFGTGKLGDLAGFSSALVLAMIALLIGYEAVIRLLHPVAIDFGEALPIAVVGLMVNIASAWLLSGGEHAQHHHHDAAHDHGGAPARIARCDGDLLLEIFEANCPPRFRLSAAAGALPTGAAVETARPDGATQRFSLADRGTFLESLDEVPEPHDFVARVLLPGQEMGAAAFHEHQHDHTADRDNNMRAAFIHVVADAAVSVLAIIGLSAGWIFGWGFLDPVMGLIGTAVIANWSYGLVRDTGAILLDMTPDRQMAARIRRTIETDGDVLTDLHLWRLGPGHLGAIVAVATHRQRGVDFYRRQLDRFGGLSHVTVEVRSSTNG
jgi:cation diffusion facilitator family transporter